MSIGSTGAAAWPHLPAFHPSFQKTEAIPAQIPIARVRTEDESRASFEDKQVALSMHSSIPAAPRSSQIDFR